ncbi:c2H2-type domain-containing protein [Nephila pilipes]|uniref:C2H2-type domain-containing protein n=1 Tax=Nephila pilipes TaxID=299642 RepID=A0A8X6MGQ6_NEPPI|nr:c2H2-type domain-containing protein [Nephila pilipes]
MPSVLNLKFRHFNKCVKHRYAVYSVFECLLSKISSTLPDPIKSFTSPIEKHIPASFAFVVVNHENDILYYKYYAEEHISEFFPPELKAISLKNITEFKRVNKIELDDITSYSPYYCAFCREFFNANSISVRHHSHDSNCVLGLAHQLCNFYIKKTFFIPVHNSRNYNTYLLLKYPPPYIDKGINITPVNIEKITMFTLDILKYLDFYRFFGCILGCIG